MKKLYLLLSFLLVLGSLNAQDNKKMKIAVMEFKPGVGVTSKEVEGLSDMLINTLFETKKFDIVERSQLNKVLEEQNLQGSELTIEQLAQVGRILGVESVLVGTVNFLAEHRNLNGSVIGEYNVDVRAVDVESGQIVTTAGATKPSDASYRSMMEAIAIQLAINLMDDELVLRNGLITLEKGFWGKFYALDGKMITTEQYIELINSCPESKYVYEKGCKQARLGRKFLIYGGGASVAAVLIGAIIDLEDIGVVIGASSAVITAGTSIPFLLSGNHKKKNAYKVYNEYCAQPTTATLSFGPATKGVGVGLYLNF